MDDQLPAKPASGPAIADAIRELQPFRRDPVIGWFLHRDAWVTPVFFLGFYGLLALATLADGTFWSIPAPPGRYPPDAQLVPFVREYFGPVFLLLWFPAIVLYARLLNARIRHTVQSLYERGILTAEVEAPQAYVAAWQKRFDSRWAWLASALFMAWFLAFWVAARLGALDGSLGIVVHASSRDAVFAFAWILALSVLGSHLFMSVLWRGAVSASRIHHTFRKERDPPIRLKPLHPDNCCGLRFVGDFTLLNSGYIAFFPLFLSLLVWFYPRFLDNAVTGWLLVYAGAAFYLVVATFAFVGPTYSAHRRMHEEREDMLNVLNEHFFQRYDEVFEKLHEIKTDPAKVEEKIRLLNNIREYYREVGRRAVWPFNLRVVSEFAGVVGAPLLLLFLERLRG